VARSFGLVVRAAAACHPIYVLLFAVLFTLALTLMEGVTWAVVDVHGRRQRSRERGRSQLGEQGGRVGWPRGNR